MTNIAILNQCRHTTSDLVLPMDENLAARLLDSGEIELSTLAPVVVTETESETLVSLVSDTATLNCNQLRKKVLRYCIYSRSSPASQE